MTNKFLFESDLCDFPSFEENKSSYSLKYYILKVDFVSYGMLGLIKCIA